VLEWITLSLIDSCILNFDKGAGAVAHALYILTCLTTVLCSALLLRAYARSRQRLLLWSGLCFLGLTISNLFLIADLVLFPGIDFYTYRTGSAAVAMALLVYGLIWETR
jgi:hypothetical protein